MNKAVRAVSCFNLIDPAVHYINLSTTYAVRREVSDVLKEPHVTRDHILFLQISKQLK